MLQSSRDQVVVSYMLEARCQPQEDQTWPIMSKFSNNLIKIFEITSWKRATAAAQRIFFCGVQETMILATIVALSLLTMASLKILCKCWHSCLWAHYPPAHSITAKKPQASGSSKACNSRAPSSGGSYCQACSASNRSPCLASGAECHPEAREAP